MESNTKNNSSKAKNFNWQNVLQKIDETREKIEQGWTPPLQKQKQILAARAKALARSGNKIKPAENNIDVVEFVLAYETYAIESSFIRKVFPLKDFTPLPGMPFFLLGVTNVRGEIISVIDIRKFFDLPEKGLTDLNKLIILSNGIIEFGILADAIIGTQKIPLADIQQSLPTLTDVRANYLKGISVDRVIILDAQKLFWMKRLFEHDKKINKQQQKIFYRGAE